VGYKYWEDLVDKKGPPKVYGPVVFTSELLDSLLDIMGERHPIHDNTEFARQSNRRQRIVPGGFIHSITSGWIVKHGAPVAIVGLRSMSWSFVRPLFPDVPFWFTSEVTKAEEVDERLGLLESTRRVFDEEERTYAVGRMSSVIRRQSAASKVRSGKGNADG
jgi:acyl dehydratase